MSLSHARRHGPLLVVLAAAGTSGCLAHHAERPAPAVETAAVDAAELAPAHEEPCPHCERSTAAAAPTVAPPLPATPGASSRSPPPPPPFPPPLADATGCVDVDAFRTYAARLEAEQRRALVDTLAAADASLETRRGFFLDESFAPAVGSTYAAGERSFAVIAALDDTAPPEVEVATTGDGAVHPVEPELRVHPVELSVCRRTTASVSAVGGCAPGRGTLVRVRHLAIELAPGEHLGPPLRPPLDAWRAVEVEVVPAFGGCQPVP